MAKSELDIFFYDVKKFLNEKIIRKIKEEVKRIKETKKWTPRKIFRIFIISVISLYLIVLIAPYIIPLILFFPFLLMIIANLYQMAEQADEAVNHTSIRNKLDELIKEMKKK